VEKQADIQITYEQTLVSIARALPPNRADELLDFARFLQNLATKESDEEEWEQLLAKPEAQRVMLEMARKAREDLKASRATEITLTDDGRLAPG